MKVKKGDNVLIIKGKDRGKSGIVQKAIPEKNKIIITGINIAKHHLKPSRKNPHGGIIDMLSPIDVSNVVLVCPHCSRPVRVAYSKKGNLKERICRKCQGNIEMNPSASLLESSSKSRLGVKEKNVK